MRRLHVASVLGLVVVPWAAVSGQTTAAAAARARDTTGSLPVAAVVTGTVFDSVSNTPLRHALVQLGADTNTGTVHSATTDSAGVYRFDGVSAGSYVITFFHPALDRLGLVAAVRRLQVADDSVVRLDFGIPSAHTVRAVLCPPATASDSSGLLIGHVHNADTGAPLDGSTVVVTWHELVLDSAGVRQGQAQRTGQSNEEGLYVICGVPTDAAVLARAEQGAAASGFIELRIEPRGLLQRDFGIGSPDSMAVATTDTAAANTLASADGAELRRGTARLEGMVRSATGEPMPDAQLFVRGSIEQGTSDAQGHFALAHLPTGTFTLEARRVGFAPKRVAVDLASHRTTTVTVTLDKAVSVLDRVTVYGKARENDFRMAGFLERARAGIGHFMAPVDIAKVNALYLSDLFRRIPGVSVLPVGGFGHSLVVRGGNATLAECQPTVYLDGVRVFSDEQGNIDDIMPPGAVAAIEMYEGPSEVPVEYQATGSTCGVALIWTKGTF